MNSGGTRDHADRDLHGRRGDGKVFINSGERVKKYIKTCLLNCTGECTCPESPLDCPDWTGEEIPEEQQVVEVGVEDWHQFAHQTTQNDPKKVNIEGGSWYKDGVGKDPFSEQPLKENTMSDKTNQAAAEDSTNSNTSKEFSSFFGAKMSKKAKAKMLKAVSKGIAKNKKAMSGLNELYDQSHKARREKNSTWENVTDGEYNTELAIVAGAVVVGVAAYVAYQMGNNSCPTSFSGTMTPNEG